MLRTETNVNNYYGRVELLSDNGYFIRVTDEYSGMGTTKPISKALYDMLVLEIGEDTYDDRQK